jgi:Tfp pilus assembly PilM family ATPase
MLRFFMGKPGLGIEITSSAVRLASVSRTGAGTVVLYTKSVELPVGMVTETYSSPNISDQERFNGVLRECLAGAPHGVRRAALSLPDGVFRVQTLEFDELPPKTVDRERLIRWRLEKCIAFDIADTLLRYQVLRQQDKGFAVLACVAKRAVVAQYEALLAAAGLEPWSVGLSSFCTLNFYSSLITAKSAVSALAHITEDSFATIIVEADGARFYRYKEIKRTGPGEIKARFMREIEDSLHFYTHRDRAQHSEVKSLYLTGESSLPADLAEGLRSVTSLEVQVLSPAAAIPSAIGLGLEMAAALGAGSAL